MRLDHCHAHLDSVGVREAAADRSVFGPGWVSEGRRLGAVCVMGTITRLAPVTRSIAPPMPGTILPGTIQFASSPRIVDAPDRRRIERVELVGDAALTDPHHDPALHHGAHLVPQTAGA
jgi:hypothetical protein